MADEGNGDAIMTPAEILERLRQRRAAYEAPGGQPVSKMAEPPQPRQAVPYQSMPLDALPAPLDALSREASAALGCDPAYVVLPALAVCAGAIGNSRAIRLRKDWWEPCVLWTGVVGDSGTLKTPAYRVAMAPLYAAHKEMKQQHKREMARWRKQRDEEVEAEKPVERRAFCSDVTIERITEILEDNPRGTLSTRDELRGWFGSFSRYKAAGADGDLANWLSMYNAGPIVYDRKTGERRSVFVERGAVSVTGTIQPGILARVMTDEHFDAGLASRLLMAWPDRRRKRWTEAEISGDVEGGYRDLIGKLLALSMRTESDGDGGPYRIGLTSEARDCWIDWYEEWADVQFDSSGELLAAYSKLEAVAARLALLHHVVSTIDVQWHSDPPPVTRTSVEAGVVLTRWFAGEVRRIYSVLRESDVDRDRRRLVEWIIAHEGRTTAKQLQRSNGRLYPTSDAARDALQSLVEIGWGRWESRPAGPKGGRPTEDFILTLPKNDETETDETSKSEEILQPGGVSAGSEGNGVETEPRDENPGDGFDVSAETPFDTPFT